MKMAERKPIGLLLAAGRGRRLGGNKQFHLVPTIAGKKPLVAAAFDTIAPVCEKMFVVLGHRADEVATALKKGSELFLRPENSSDPFAYVSQYICVDPDAPMFNSVQVGLRAALTADPTAKILLQLGDHPALQPSTIEKIFAVAQVNPDKAVMPTFGDNGGHPVLIPASLAAMILAAECPDGLRQFWLEHAELCVRIPVDDEGVVQDIDTLL